MYLNSLFFYLVKNLLESGIDLPTKTETIHDLKTLCLTLLDNLNDKNLALNHQKKTNKYDRNCYIIKENLFSNNV